MKNAAVYAGLVASAFFTLGQATVNLTLVPAVNTVRIGEQVNLEWTTDQDYVRLTKSISSSRISHTNASRTETRAGVRPEVRRWLVPCQICLQEPPFQGWRWQLHFYYPQGRA